ncbi:helix-turn-helix domain-containing protein [Anaerocolumna sedimenticola]|uniref:Helix-turn-helix domain-containing protein n=1 Tax=Anaerocolumna sedimenticola TaxID=2696063 RepID=A0A6P1TJV1_9FIRM|nr:SRPBCC domain-containing protein [Anaerocolumna sedimenticola]QHQ60186.1 helix-turn-helix domain-containing protein [Anaerocolumna sedimenticola]
MDNIFNALGDKSRRYLLDLLYERNGQSLTELSSKLDMSRQAVTKHLKILESANLVIPVWKGKEKLHYLNPVPLRLIYSRWINKFDEIRMEGLYELKNELENTNQEVKMKGFIYQIVIASTAEKVWESLTKPEFTQKFWFGRSISSDWKAGSSVSVITPEGEEEVKGKVVEFDPFKRLSYTWQTPDEQDKEPTTVVFELQEMGPMVKLTILHDIDTENAKFQQAAAGWTFILCGLKTFLETGAPMPSMPWKK